MAVFLPVRIVGYASFEDSVEYREKLTTYGDQDVHFCFTFSNPKLEVRPVSRYKPNSPYRQHPDNFPHILVAGMVHPGMFQPVATSLEALRTPAKMG